MARTLFDKLWGQHVLRELGDGWTLLRLEHHLLHDLLGLVLPGLAVVCRDGHSCTKGAMGALTFSANSSDITHALSSQTIRRKKPAQARIECKGILPKSVTLRDLASHAMTVLAHRSQNDDWAIEYTGPTIGALGIEARMELCRHTGSEGARFSLIGPDLQTIEWIRRQPFAPKGRSFELASAYWQSLETEPGAVFDCEVVIDASSVPRQIGRGYKKDLLPAGKERRGAADRGTLAATN